MATNVKILVSDILQLISDLRGETAVNTDSKRIRAVSNGERDYARRRMWRIHRLPNQTMSGNGTNALTIGSATFPMRNKGLIELFVGGTTESSRILVLDYNRYKVEYNKNASARIAYEWYDVVNDVWKLFINPAPAVSDTVTYTYFWEPPVKSNTTDYVYCTNPYIVARLALADIYESEDELDKQTEELQLAETLIDEEVGDEDTPAENQTYAMQPIESSVRPRGMGSY